MSKIQIRRAAYEYIKDQINRVRGSCYKSGQPTIVPLDELLLLKEGIADPSRELVASLKQSLTGLVPEAEIDAHLVTPFRQAQANQHDKNDAKEPTRCQGVAISKR